ncbi:PAS domain S-box protein [Cerasicoccus arenae]|uniref:histidine kinase n=1 Tax=Cerasicoccus arenae TaxID=424488 RepID=A0A8J3GF75_9BACT|nr:PAS domain S-box protein [Cerasicoccus arenae]MBK1857881.1 PAS domain S-box protein [Cerasicoccus arenae]GHC09432.1 hypothetical protein GCM10007047_28320 [Cerasicoccus arenae]
MEPRPQKVPSPSSDSISPLLAQSHKHIPESEASFRAAFDASGIGMAICTKDGRWVRVNESLCRIVGYQREKLLGLTFLEITHPDDIEMSLAHLQDITSSGKKEYRIEKRYIHAKGHAIWVNLTVSAVHDAKGKLLFFVSQIEDVTENRRLERELKTVNERLALATRAGGVGVWDWDVLNDRLTWDEQMFALYGTPPVQLNGIESIRQWIHPDDVSDYFKKLQETLEGGELLNILFRVLKPDGSEGHLRAFATVERNAKGKPVRMVGTNWDISDAVKQKQNLQSLAEQAKQASLAKSQFLANVSHEIRTPLNGVIGMTHLLLDTPGLPEQHRETADLILSSSESLMLLINQILDFAKAESGKLELDVHRFNVRAVMRQLSSPLSIRAEKAGIAFSSNVDKKTPQRLRGDSGKLKQIIHNLADNAIKFTKEGKIELSVRVLEETRSDVWLRFSIRDTGIGIEPSVQKRLFSAFMQADASTTRLYGGTGLGLAISKEIVELMGGKIGINSEPGKGSEFWFTAQFEKAPETSSGFPEPFSPINVKKAAQAKSAKDELKERVRRRSAHVLLADDNRVNQLVACGMLDRLGVTVDTAANGLEAIEYFRQNNYDLVFMDIQMPVVDGLEAALAMREWEAEHQLPITPVIAMTAHARAEDRRACMAAGMNECIVKPLSPDNVAEVVDRCLGTPQESVEARATRTAALLDFTALTKRLGDDQALIREVLAMSTEDLKQIHSNYLEAVAKNDPALAARHLHTLIGVSASASFCRFSAAATCLEKYLVEQKAFMPADQAPNLEHILRESLTAAVSYLASADVTE